MIRTTKNSAAANAVTHSGCFHADEILATVILAKALKKDINVLRASRVPEDIAADVVVYDIGGGDFDHHQAGGNGTRENGVPYASAGLIWKEYGMAVCNGDKSVFDQIDRDLVQGVDALDNGYDVGNTIELCSVSNIISSWNPNWDSDEDADAAFDDACTLMQIIFNKMLASAQSKSRAKQIVEDGIEASDNGVMVLAQFAPWQEHVFASTNPKAEAVQFVVFPSNRGGYTWQCVPDALGSFGQRKPVPAEWRGLRDETLRQLTGVATATFCHPAGFIGGCETKEDAILMARMAVNGVIAIHK